MRAELAAAHDAQMAIMPHGRPRRSRASTSPASASPANEVGGDFFDYFRLDGGDGRLCVAVGDVSARRCARR